MISAVRAAGFERLEGIYRCENMAVIDQETFMLARAIEHDGNPVARPEEGGGGLDQVHRGGV